MKKTIVLSLIFVFFSAANVNGQGALETPLKQEILTMLTNEISGQMIYNNEVLLAGAPWIRDREEFTDTFMRVLRNTYIGKTDNYKGQKIVYIRELVHGKRGKVQTNFFTSDGTKVIVDFSMHEVDGSWKVYDVIIESVSIISNYRSQFNSILSKESFEDLMEKLKEKEEEISYLD